MLELIWFLNFLESKLPGSYINCVAYIPFILLHYNFCSLATLAMYKLCLACEALVMMVFVESSQNLYNAYFYILSIQLEHTFKRSVFKSEGYILY